MKKIFEQDELQKEKIITIFPQKINGYWMFKQENKYYNIAPANSTQIILSPLILGVDRLMVAACQSKKIKNYENGFSLQFAEEYILNCDVLLSYSNTLLDGWTYDIIPEQYKNIIEGQKAWMCPYLKFYYNDPPKQLYVKVDSK
jgi:hypothetical protein